MVSHILFQPGVNRFLTKLDDSKSMFSVAVRDGVDSSGRTIMEARRSPDGGRERLIEEFATMVIWGFGINFLKNRVYNPLVRKWTAVKNPALDMDLLSKHPQQLTPKLLEQFTRRFPGAYESLKTVVSIPALQRKYHSSNVAKFLFATGIPVALIAFGIPTFNQWLTHKMTKAPRFMGTRPRMLSITRPGSFRLFENNPQTGLRFGGLGSAAATGASVFLQNERYNTLLVDSVISGGRTVKARNWDERREILFREGSVVFFLYFAQGWIQRHASRLMDKITGTHSGLDFTATRFLNERYKNNADLLKSDFNQAMRQLEQEIPQLKTLMDAPIESFQSRLLKATKALGTGQFSRIQGCLFPPDALEKPIADAVRNYFLKGGSGNLLFETARACQWIPTMRTANGQIALDLSRKVQTGAIVDFVGMLERMALKESKGLQPMLKKAMAGRFGALMLANAVCALFLSYICPKVQHYLTYKRTGRNMFPGTA